MKLEPQYFREATRRWYSKSGMSWHVSVFVRPIKDSNGKMMFDITSHITIMGGKEKQESAVNYAIIMASLEIYQKANPDITSIVFKSDNAG